MIVLSLISAKMSLKLSSNSIVGSRLASLPLSDEDRRAILDRPELARTLGAAVYKEILTAYRHGFRVIFIILAISAAMSFATAFALMHQRTLDREDDEKLRQEGRKFIADLEKRSESMVEEKPESRVQNQGT
jgi:hypothetical protein